MQENEQVKAELVEPEVQDTRLAVFDPIQLRINNAASMVKDAVFDYADPKDNKAARSLVANIRKLKKPLTDAHRTAKAEAKAVCDALDGAKKKYMTQIEGLIEVHAVPLKELEDREKERLAELKAIEDQKRLEKDQELERKQAEQEAKEQELKAREDAVARKERDKAIAKEAEAKAKADAQAEIQKERERAEKAEAEAQERIAQAEREAKERAERDAAQKERKAAAEVKAKALEEEARRRDKAHREEVRKAAMNCMTEFMEPDLADTLFEAIEGNYINHISVNY